MRLIFSLASLPALVLAQSDRPTQSWGSAASTPTAFSSDPASYVVHGSQTATVSAPPSGSSWWSGGRWSSDLGLSSAPPWASHIPWASGGPWPAGGNSRGIHNTTFQVAILNSTNYFRYQHNASFLAWNDSLAQSAADQAGSCAWNSGRSERYGRNLARDHPNIMSSVDTWGNERGLYSFLENQSGYNETTGDFTQLVWKDTQTVGCAAMNCDGNNDIHGWYLVCKYWPVGNGNSSQDSQNETFAQNVQLQINNGSGFDEAAAVQGTAADVASTTGPSATSLTGENAANSLVDAGQEVPGIIKGHNGQLGLVIFFAFACALL